MVFSDNSGTCVECGKEAVIRCNSCNGAKICSNRKHLDVHLVKCRIARLHELLETVEKLSKISYLIKSSLLQKTLDFLYDPNNKLFLFLPKNSAITIFLLKNKAFDITSRHLVKDLVLDHIVNVNEPDNSSKFKTFNENLAIQMKNTKKYVKNESKKYMEEMKDMKKLKEMETELETELETETKMEIMKKEMKDNEESLLLEETILEKVSLRSLTQKIINIAYIKKVKLMIRRYFVNGDYFYDLSTNYSYAISVNNAIVTNEIRFDKYGKIFCIDEVLDTVNF